MLKASAEYKEEMNRPIRNRAYVSVSLGVVNQTAQSDATVSGSTLYYSNGNVFEETQEMSTYATFEENFTPCDGTFLFVPEENEISEQFKLNGLTFNYGTSFRIDFGRTYDIKGLTIDFGSAYPTSLKIETDNGEETYSNESERFVIEDVFNAITYIIVTPLVMVGGSQRMHIRNVLMGVGFVFDNTTTQDVSIEQYVSAISEEVSFANYNVNLFDRDNKFNVDNDESFMSYLNAMQPIKISFGQTLENGLIEWKQVANAFLKEWSSQKGTISITATDRLTQLENEYEHNVIQSRTAYSEFVAIFAECEIKEEEYDIDEYLKSVYITNPIKKAPYRECLQILANACRCIVYEDENAVIHVKANFENVIDPEEVTVIASAQTEYSTLDNLFTGAPIEYADLTTNAMSVNGTTTFIPEDNNYLSAGFVSDDISDENGEYISNPYIEITLPAIFNYYGIAINWGGQPPTEVQIKTFKNNVLSETFTFSDLESESTLLEDFTFDKMRIEITKTLPYARVTVNKIKFGSATDFNLSKSIMLDNPFGYKEQRVKNIKVKIYTYELKDGKPSLVNDEVYYTHDLNLSGVDKIVENPLISTQAQAKELAEWLGNYYRNNVSYSVSYRGDPRIQGGDIITMDSDYIDNLTVEIQSARLNYNGSFKGDLDLRRALKFTNNE